MRPEEKKKLRNEIALKKIQEPIVLDSKLLRKQVNNLSDLTRTVNNEIGDDLIGAVQVLEVFEWLPKGAYTIQIKIV